MIILKIFAHEKFMKGVPEISRSKILENGEVEMKTEPLAEE